MVGSASHGDFGRQRDDGCVVVVNPESGSGDHPVRVRSLADRYGFEVRETDEAGDARRLARNAVRAGADRLGACGGDGTVNEVVRGIDDADGFDRVTLGVIPAGTGNNFATNVGVEGIDHGFDLLVEGDTRAIDLGVTGHRPFVNSCICGLTASASGKTSSELKRRFGEFAYVIKTIETVTGFDPIPLRVRTGVGEATTWTGDAVFVLVGNARRFPAGGDRQADVEDGRFDVTIIEEVPTTDLLRDAAVERLLGGETTSTTRLMAETIDIEIRRDEPVSFSFDGEMASLRELSCTVRPRTVSLRVGDGYAPEPNA